MHTQCLTGEQQLRYKQRNPNSDRSPADDTNGYYITTV